MKRKSIIVVTITLIVVLITVKLIANKATIEANKSFKGSVSARVNVVPVVKKMQGSTLAMTGVTAGKEEVTVKSEANGQVVAVNFNLGDYVQKGKVLVEIDDKLAQLALESAKLNLARAEDEYNKTKNLFSGQATTENRVRDSKIDYERAQINYEQALKQLSFTKITAPQNGYVVSKQIEKGLLVNNGTPVLNIVNISQLKITVKAAEKDVYNLKIGQQVKITSSVFPGVEYNGRVSFVSQQGDAFHNYPVEVTLENKSTSQLKSGTFVNVEFNFTSSQPSLLIPREALVGSIKNAKVFVVENNTASERNITIGRDLGDSLEILSGLNEGEQIVVAGQINITDGSQVIILNK